MSEQFHQLLIEAALEAIIVAGEDGVVLEWNRACEQLFGYSRDEALGMSLVRLMPEPYRQAHSAAMARLAAGGSPRMAGRVLQLAALRKDGSEAPVEMSLSTFDVDGVRLFSAFIRDRTELTLAEGRLQTQFAVTQAIAQSQSVMDAIPRIVDVVCRNHQWAVGAAWTVSPRRDRLKCDFFWSEEELPEFREVTLATDFVFGEGLPGMAWATGEPQWVTEFSQRSEFARAQQAGRSGLHSALAFPVTANGEVAGVFEFFSRETRAPDDAMLELMAYVGRQIGLLMQRAFAHESVEHIVEQMQMGLFIFLLEDADDHESLTLKSWNPAAARLLLPDPSRERKVEELFCGAKVAMMSEALANTARTQRPVEFNGIRCQGSDGEPLVLNLRAFPLPDRCVGVAFEDVTPQARAEELLASERELLGLVSVAVDQSTIVEIANHCVATHPAARSATVALVDGPVYLRSSHDDATFFEGRERLDGEMFAAASALPSSSHGGVISTLLPAESGFEGGSCWGKPFFSPKGELRGALLLYLHAKREVDFQEARLLQLYANVCSVVAERVATEASLRVSERRFRTLTLATTQAVWQTDPQGHVFDDLPSWRRITGQTLQELQSDGWLAAVHPDDLEATGQEWERARREQSTFQRVMRIRTADGTYHDFAVRGVPLVENGVVREWIGIANDITERLGAERALSEREQRLSLVVEATGVVVWDWNLIDDSLWWGEGFRTHLGHDGTDRSIESWTGNLHPDDADRVTRSIHSAIELRLREWSDEYRFRRADGSYVRIADRGLLLFGDDGTPVRMIGAMTDVTEQRLLESQFEQMKRVSSLGRLAASMAHEFNNVLMGIQPFTEVIRRLSPEQPRVQDATSRILQSIQRGRKVTDEILRYTRRIDPVVRDIEVVAWLNEFRHEAQGLSAGRMEISIEPPPGELHILGDLAQLNQVMANLVINARDASSAGGSLHIRAERVTGEGDDHGFVHITVHDEGHGMDSSTLEHIFDPLFTTKKGGTGLGLAISQQVIVKHGGRIYAESSPGNGTTFHLLLPGSGGEAQPRVEKPTLQALPQSVLIVDDEVDIADGIAQLLEAEGIVCATVHRGGEAIGAIDLHDPSIVLLDIGLPDVSGIDVFHSIRERWPLRPVIFMTGHYSRADIASLLSLPAVGFLEKPFEIEALITLLRRHAAAE